jgi:hypothetical protein
MLLDLFVLAFVVLQYRTCLLSSLRMTSPAGADVNPITQIPPPPGSTASESAQPSPF